MSNNLQMPFQDIVGEDSPVQQALKHLRILADEKPMPNANSDQSRSASALVLTHLLGLCDSAIAVVIIPLQLQCFAPLRMPPIVWLQLP